MTFLCQTSSPNSLEIHKYSQNLTINFCFNMENFIVDGRHLAVNYGEKSFTEWSI